MIKLLLDDIRSGAKCNSNDTRSLRYIIDNVFHAALHKKLGIDKDIENPDFVYMSEEFKAQWESLGMPTGISEMRKIGIHEHTIPLNILISRMVQVCVNEQSIYDFIEKNTQMVFVTKEEDKKLNEAGYQRVMAVDDGDRYNAVGIIVHKDPVLYKNIAKHRKKK